MEPSQGPPGTGGEGMNAAAFQNMQRLQQQLQAQYNRAQQPPHPGGAQAGQPPQQQSQPQQSQQHAQLSQDFIGMNPQLATLQGSTAAARMLLQQQQQAAAGSNLGQLNLAAGGNAASVLGNWGSLQQAVQAGGNVSSTLDASSGSSARLLAMSGMGMAGANAASSAASQNIQALLQQKSPQGQFSNQVGMPNSFQVQQQQMMSKSVSNTNMGAALRGQDQNPGSLSVATAQMTPQQHLLFQQQFANLQKQVQQQQQQQQQQQVGGGGGISASAAAAVLRNAGVNLQGTMAMQAAAAAAASQQQQQQQQQNPQFARQQQLLHQLQLQQQQRSNGNQVGLSHASPQGLQTQQSSQSNDSSSMIGLNQQHMSALQQQSSQGVPNSSSLDNNSTQLARGSINEAQLRLQQQNFLRASSAGQQAMGNDALEAARRMFAQAQQQAPSTPGTNFSALHAPSQSHHGGLSTSSSNSVGQNQPQQGSHHGVSGMMDASMHSFQSGASDAVLQAAAQSTENSSMNHDQQSFLDGNFAGGWQSNNDLPDRRRIIFHILDVIRAMRPENSKMSSKLPHMAKSLEEHLYRSAQTKEQYLDMSTLKQRLQAIAHGLEVHRSTSSSSTGSAGGQMQQGAHQSLHLQMQQQQQPQQDSVPAPSPVAGHSNSVWMLQQNPSQMALQASASQHSTFNGSLDTSQSRSTRPVSASGAIGAMGSNTHSPADFLQGSNLQNLPAQQDPRWGVAQNPSLVQASQLQPSSFGGLTPQQASVAMSQGNIGNLSNLAALQMMGQNVNIANLAASMSQAQDQRQQQPPSHLNAGQSMQQQRLNNESGLDGVAGATAGGQDPGGQDPGSQSKFQDPTSAQKKKVILQQQQRLLLLRHASKCTAGPSCPTKFCSQMVTLWRHMKTCRDKNCRTPHCLSSRCVLNHYRICKSNGKTATCEVCGPVMSKIKQVERDNTSSDPLAREQEKAFATTQLAPQSAPIMQQFTQSHSVTEQNQLQMLQSQHMKLQARLENLQQLQRQQTQLLDQQRRLQEQAQTIKDPNSQQAQQLQQQQMLLSQLQKRCQQQQLLLQRELQEQAGGAVTSQLQAQQMQVQQQQMQMLQASQSLQDAPELQGVAGMQSSEARPIQDIPQSSAIPEPDALTVDAVKKRRSRTDGKALPPQRGGKGRRGSGIGKTMTMSQLAAVTDVQPKKRQGASTPKERSQKKSKRSSSESSPMPDTEHAPVSSTGTGSVCSESTLVSCMTKEEISRHLESLNKRIWLSSRTVSHKCLPIIQDLIDDQFGWVFIDAVDPVALGLPDYLDVVKNPMHLELVKKKLENAIYSDMETFERDVKLVFENAILYNGEDSEVGELAQTMLGKFDKLYKDVVQGIESSHQRLENKGEVCSLCGSQKRLFEPTVLYCQGRCGMQRIKRQATYFADRTKQNHWCEDCYGHLNPDEPIVLDDGNEILKRDLQESKNDAVPEEGWVNCDECKTWVHQICALFNGRTNKSSATFTCPNCHVHQLSPGQPSPLAMKGSKELPESRLSRAIEKGLAEVLAKEYESRAKELGCGIEEVEKAEGLTVRVLSNVDKNHYVGDEMAQFYKEKGCPTAFPVRTKCIALFQKIHGVDTLLFALYVYEYGQDCPAPNKRRVYISYLDSVQYFEPKCYRTAAYHAILIEYLRYVKVRGFHTAHLWSCPPTPGDDYVFYCHPKHQKVPREDMLRGWYHKMLEKAKALGIVIRTTTLYDEYFRADAVDVVPGQRYDATCLPYFEGDYIPGEIENIIRHLKANTRADTKSGSEPQHDDVMARLGHNLLKMQDNFIVVHLRNRRFAAAVERGEDVSNWREDSDEELIRSKRAKISGKDSSVAADKEVPVSERQNEPSAVTSTAGVTPPVSVLDPLSQTMNGEVSKECMAGPSDLTMSPEDDHTTGRDVSTPQEAQAVDSECAPADGPAATSHVPSDSQGPAADVPSVVRSVEVLAGVEAPGEASSSEVPCDNAPASAEVPSSDPSANSEETAAETRAANTEAPTENERPEYSLETTRTVSNGQETHGSSSLAGNSPMDPDNALSAKRGFDEMKKMVASHVAGHQPADVTVGDTVDDDEPFESDLFESRQLFLNYCQTTHCQFDELRRAKHSSMMALFQLHNPTAPKFLQQCGSCYLDITHGTRYHCNSCPDFDLCEDCYEPVTSGLWAKRDARFAHDKSHTFTPIDTERAAGSTSSREDRQKALKAHIDLLEHAGRCPGSPSCSLQNCERMKGLFQHVRTCEVKPRKDCRICSRLLSLCAMHARMCSVRSGACSIPFCDRIRERHMRLRRQQQQMDDRRRQAQNELYHAGES